MTPEYSNQLYQYLGRTEVDAKRVQTREDRYAVF